jgi:hypothetical protein
VTVKFKDHVAVRLDAETFARLDAVQAKMGEQAQVLGVILTQSDAVRAAILAGLIVLEKQHGLPVRKVLVGQPPDARDRPRGKPRRKR